MQQRLRVVEVARTKSYSVTGWRRSWSAIQSRCGVMWPSWSS